MPILGYHVSGIVSSGTKKEVVRVYTISNVAFMTNEVSAGNLAAKETPCHAMSSPFFVPGDP